jgi:ATP-binding cassette subfamily B protein
MKEFNIDEKKVSGQKALAVILRLLKESKRNWYLVAGFIFFIGISALMQSYGTYLTRQIIDLGIGTKSIEKTIHYITLFGFTTVLNAVCVFGFIFCSGVTSERLVFDLRMKLFSHFQNLSFSFFDRVPTGQIMSRITSDTSRMSEFASWMILDLTWGSMQIVISIFFMFSIDAKLSLIVLSLLPVIIIAAVYFRKIIILQFEKVRNLNSKIINTINENITGIRVVKNLTREKRNLENFSNITDDMKRTSFRAAWLSVLFLPLIQIIMAVMIGIVIWQGGIKTQLGIFTIGGINAFIGYIAFMIWPIQDLANVFARMQHALVCSSRVFNLLDTKPEILNIYGAEVKSKISGDIEFQNVNFHYNEENPVLKSTIVNLVARFYEPVSGRILVDGKDYKEFTAESYHSRFGIVLQTPHLFSGTIRDNIRYGRIDASEDEIIEAAKNANAYEFITGLKKGFDEEIGEGGVILSKGQKQLLSLARAVLAKPDILIMDEATSSIDTQSEMTIQHAMNYLFRQTTSFIIAHRLSTIKHADRILVIEKGRIVEDGNHDALIKNRGQYYKLYMNQFKIDLSYKDAVQN